MVELGARCLLSDLLSVLYSRTLRFLRLCGSGTNIFVLSTLAGPETARMATTDTTLDVVGIAGPLLVGYILNWGLYGVLSMQVSFPKDPLGHKALVYGSFALESAQTFLFTSSAFRTFATGFGNPEMLNEVDILWFTVPIMSGIVAFVVQSFYAYRVSILSRTQYVAGLIVLCAFLQLGGALAMGVKTKQAVLFTRFQHSNFSATAAIWEGGSAACNIVIAVSMLYSYIKARDIELKLKSNLLTNLIRLIIETGTLTAIIAIVTVILTFLPGRPLFYQASICILGKLYTNSMMVAFNSRMKIGSASTGTAHEVDLPPSAVDATTTASLSFPGMSGGDTTTGIGAGTNGTELITSSGDESSYPTTATTFSAQKDGKRTSIGEEDVQALSHSPKEVNVPL
ncbi:hypothetical protein D9619_012090 [Psilocybe cf. subviscida]|uniref:DUF6534 domain-containing protein n=1 Tax=Psilocybe cf. subviscida TaxID=2480587 RepID=A0A8H5B7U4_9AGAR|nr:hypothetical protein D9619_012090 [Psilocybe cf. subviscida]